MKFPRNARIFRGQLDATPFAIVFFLLVIFIMVASPQFSNMVLQSQLGSVLYTPGVQIRLPLADNLPGTDKQTIVVAVDANDRLYYDNEGVDEAQLRSRLAKAAKAASEPLTLIIQADQAASHGMLTRLEMWARDAGITNGLLATLPRPLATSP